MKSSKKIISSGSVSTASRRRNDSATASRNTRWPFIDPASRADRYSKTRCWPDGHGCSEKPERAVTTWRWYSPAGPKKFNSSNREGNGTNDCIFRTPCLAIFPHIIRCCHFDHTWPKDIQEWTFSHTKWRHFELHSCKVITIFRVDRVTNSEIPQTRSKQQIVTSERTWTSFHFPNSHETSLAPNLRKILGPCSGPSETTCVSHAK